MHCPRCESENPSRCIARWTCGSGSRRTGEPRAMIRAHLLRWRPRPHAQRTGSTPRVRPSGAASQLDPSHRSSQSVLPGAGVALFLVLVLLPGGVCAETPPTVRVGSKSFTESYILG